MFKKAMIFIIIVFAIGCKTVETTIDNNAETKKKENKNIDDNAEETAKKNESKIEVLEYGADSEIKAIDINGKKYYVLNANDIENMTEDEIKNSSLVAPLKITEETIKGNDGIVIKYYDVQIFLGKKNRFGATKVGLFEPQYRAWTVGEDKKRNSDIELKLSNSTVSITIKRGSISLRYY